MAFEKFIGKEIYQEQHGVLLGLKKCKEKIKVINKKILREATLIFNTSA